MGKVGRPLNEERVHDPLVSIFIPQSIALMLRDMKRDIKAQSGKCATYGDVIGGLVANAQPQQEAQWEQNIQ